MLSEAIRAQILTVNAAFYAAFRDADANAVMACWADGAVTCIPGLGEPAFTRADVERGFREAFRPPPDVDLTFDVLDVAFADPVATVTCAERLSADGQVFDFLATNVWVVGDTGWRLTHHHASWRAAEMRGPIPA